jgi:hypothetical protein
MALGFDSASNRNEYQEYFLGGKRGRCVRLTTYVPLSRNLGTLTSWNPLGLYGSVMGLLYLFAKHYHKQDPSPWQCASPCSVFCTALFDIQRHYGDAAASLFTWSRAVRLRLMSKSKIGDERTPFWINRRHTEVCNAGFKRHSSNCVTGMLQIVAAPLESVCAGTRDVLWRWQWFSWWINKRTLFFGTSLITLLSDLICCQVEVSVSGWPLVQRSPTESSASLCVI